MSPLLLFGLLASGAPDEPVAFATLGYRENLYYVEAQVEGSKKTLQLMLDTGASTTVVWAPEVAAGKNDVRPMAVNFGHGQVKIEVGLLSDVPKGFAPLRGGKLKFDGILGCSLFSGYTVGLDLKGKCLAFFPRDQFLYAARFWFSTAYVPSEKTPVRWVRNEQEISGVEGGPYRARQMYPSLVSSVIAEEVKIEVMLDGNKITGFFDTGSDTCNFRTDEFDDIRKLKVLRIEEMKSVLGISREKVYSVTEIGFAGFKVQRVETTIIDKFPNLVSSKAMLPFKWLFSKSEGATLVAAY